MMPILYSCLLISMLVIMAASVYKASYAPWTREMHRSSSKPVTTHVAESASVITWFHEWWSLKVLKRRSA